MRYKVLLLGSALLAGSASLPPAGAATASPAGSDPAAMSADRTSKGSVTVGGQHIAYHAVAGTLLVHDDDYDDSAAIVAKRAPEGEAKKKDGEAASKPVASIFYTAYFKDNAPAEKRPITFLYNGGPGSASLWLHIGSFGPMRVNTPGDRHPSPGPSPMISNPQSLLDVSDLVFIDAPGAGFSRIAGKDSKKAFLGVDGDAAAFAQFITQFLAKYHRYNSPKYLFGESYGTMRSVLIASQLQQKEGIDLNGVILLSQILNYDNNVDLPELNPGVDTPYILALPTYAATAWYHRTLPHRPDDLKTFLKDVEHFASTDYALALQQGADLPADERQKIAEKLHDYTSLPVDYILRANLRITGGMFSQQLKARTGDVTGRLDTRFSGPTLDPLSKEIGYDPQSNALSSTYVTAFNHYVRTVLHYGENENYRLFNREMNWNFRHHQADLPAMYEGLPNVMNDLATTMKTNPTLHVMLNSGYYDLATPYYEGIYEMKHLPIPARLQKNIEYASYESGHMVYVDQNMLQQLHDNVARFIDKTSSAH